MNIYSGKVAIVTGAGSGIGKGLAEELARHGARLVVCDISRERIQGVAAGIVQSGGKATASTLDVSSYEAVKKMVDDALAAHGQIDYLFNNAGIAVGGPAKDFSIEDWRRVIDTNLYGAVYGAAVAFPIMVKQGFGHIVNTASIEGIVPFPGTSSYVASKYGVVGLSNALRIEGADHGVRVSVVCPGYVRTAIFTDSKLVHVDRERTLKSMPDWVGIAPEECARAILRGVERNRAFIVVTLFAKILWILHRLSPRFVLWLMRSRYREARKQGIIQA